MPKFPFTNYHELNLDWILKKVNALFDASEENARTIRTYETRLSSAEQTATSAATAATSAQQLADAAAANADNALSVAGTADAKADSALTASTDARNAASNSLTIAQEAQQTAGAAVATANDAAATASGLESLANTANQNATAAVETAGTAVTTANNAATAANTADQKAVAAQQTANSAQSAAATNAGNITALQTNVTDLNRQLSDLEDTVSTTQIINSASGAIASFDDGADGQPIRKLVANIEPVQDLHGYDYPWPGGASKNKLQLTANTQTVSGVTLTVGLDGTITANGTATATILISIGSVPVSEQLSFILTGCPSGGGENYRIDARKDLTTVLGLDTGSGASFTADSDINVYLRIGSGTAVSNLVFHPMIRLATETDSTFAPYSNICPISGHTGLTISHSGSDISNSETLHVTFPSSAGTVYGGTLDVTNGVLTVDKLYKKGGFVRDHLDSSGKCWLCGLIAGSYQYQAWEVADAITNYFTVSSLEVIRQQNSGATLFSGGLWIAGYANNTEALDALLPTLEVVCKMNVPITYQLTPQQLDTLLGTNNIWTDVGTVDVQYPADTKLYIDGKIAELQALVLEN